MNIRVRWALVVVVAVVDLVVVAQNRVANPGFEELDGNGGAAQWRWWTREPDTGHVEVSAERHGGERAVRIVHTGARDWNLSSATRIAVKPGEPYKVSGWMKRNGGARTGSISVVGCRGKEVVEWSIGQARGPRRNEDGWVLCQGWFTVPEGVDTIYVRVVGGGDADFWVDDVSLVQEALPAPVRGVKVEGWAFLKGERPREPMGRGVVAAETAEGGTYVGWRLLKDDPPDVAFDVFRAVGKSNWHIKRNIAPITQTTDFVDAAPFDASARYEVRPAEGFKGIAGEARPLPLEGRRSPYVRIPLASTNATAQKVAVADLDGDGVYDYVIKQPGGNVDPWHVYWYKSPETFKLEARKLDGTLLWMKDLGWNIERGMWYSPMLACDLNGNGRAEVAVKVGPDEDLRDAEGKAQAGPEWLAVLDGLTGAEIARAPWPPREAFDTYNTASRNQIAVAYLDGKTPCLLALRGTYDVMLVDAWQLKDGKLEKLWSYSNENLPDLYQGQGAHSCICADVDGDGRDEIILGSVVLDDDGTPLWCTGRGHPDAVYYGDIDPSRPGMEMAYIMEARQKQGGGIHLLDPATGKLIWQLDEPTTHVHSCGMCSDIDPTVPGLQIYGANAEGDHQLTPSRWLFACDGTLLKSGAEVDFSFGRPSAWWDADLQREIIQGGKAWKHEGGAVSERIEGNVVLVADLLGDWREEIVTTVPGELRIYTTTIPAMDRRVCLMQDTLYRSRTMMNAMGYMQVPLLSYVPEALAPNINLTIMGNVCRAVVVAPLGKAVKGKLTLTAPKGVTLEKTESAIDLAPGARTILPIAFDGKPATRGDRIRATLTLADAPTLNAAVPLGL
ncbi:MAG: carbohydrate binding domain-containing protein [Kiritimatiellaeota bacterium]|nr:carbohydrate binding domain-containing protein [Kiritimatiellota bacterium]